MNCAIGPILLFDPSVLPRDQITLVGCKYHKSGFKLPLILTHIVPLDMEGCICHFVKWQMHPFISKGKALYRYISENLLKINQIFIPIGLAVVSSRLRAVAWLRAVVSSRLPALV